MPDRATPRWLGWLTVVVMLLLVEGYLLSYLKPSLLLLDTMIAGGDTPSFLRPVHHLRDVLLPAGQLQGWDLGNFAGYAPYQFYFLPPSLLILALSLVVPFNAAFKVVTATGSFLLPVTTVLALRALGYRAPAIAVGAAASLMFLFNEGNSMWGGNIPSTLAGEFAHSMGFAFAVWFIGLLYRGIVQGRGWRSRAAVLAMAGLCHPVAFLNAATPGAFFLLRRREFGRNLVYLLLVYGTAVLLMSFWLVPLMAKIGYATSINWKWIFNSWWDLLPRVLWPPFVLAGLDVVWMAVYPRPTDRPGRYLLFCAVATTISFLNATAVGLPEIRFVPFVYYMLILLAVDFVARLLAFARAAPLGAIALGVAIATWTHANTSFIPSWIRWNYEGLERKPSWGLLQSLMDAVRGTIHDPRVAYENSPAHERFGSMRVFEDMALLSGRPTLEGVLLQTDVMSPYIYWLQSQISKQGTGVIPGYSYPALDLKHATPRLDLLNAGDMIAVTPEVIGALDSDPRWERRFTSEPYVIFRRKGADPHYVRVPRYRPVLMDTTQWKQDFHRWFASDGALDVPLVAGWSVPAADRARFPLVTASPTTLPHEPLEADCRIEESVDHLAIEFTTTCPGQPHTIAVSYYPNWHVEGASRIYMASPAFMLVYPDGNHVRLTFRRIGVDWLGLALSVTGLLICLVPARRRTALPASEAGGALATAQPWLVGAALLAVAGVTGFNVIRDIGPARFYQQGWKAFEKQDYGTAQRYFERAIFFGGDTPVAADATFFRAASLLRSGRPAEAMVGYQRVIDHFPGSVWVAESHYHVGLCLRQLGRVREARDRFRYVISTYPGNRWAGFAAEQLQQMRAERRARVKAHGG